MRSRILAISADKNWCESLSRVVAGLPHQLRFVSTAAQGWQTVEKGDADLLFLDVELPGVERLTWFKLLRQTAAGQALPAILAGSRADEEEVAEAFEHEADDFVLKQCEPAELAARLKAVLRRRSGRDFSSEAPLEIGAVTLDRARHLCLVRGRSVALNPREFQLLEALMTKAGRVLSRDYLLETIWGMDREAHTRAVDVAVSRLRRALGRRAGAWVETVERYGYRFRDPEAFAR